MLPTPVFIFTPASSGGGVYTMDVFFSPSSQAKYLRVGDIIQDVSGNQYEVTTWAASPSDNGDGGTLTTTFKTADVLPTASVSIYDGTAFTPDQLDVTVNVQTDGSISGASIFSGQNFEYTLTGAWNNSSEANKAIVGDHIIDRNGKSFEITFIDGTSRFAVPFRAKEVEAVGVIPPDGFATLYRPTPYIDLFQGVNINQIAETNIRNRDTFLLDDLSRFTQPYTNVEGATITKRQVVYESSTGNVSLARADDPLAPGITVGLVEPTSIANGVIGEVIVKPGVRVTGFDNLTPGLPVYISRTTAGDFVQSYTSFVAGEHVVCLGTALTSTDLLFLPEYEFEY